MNQELYIIFSQEFFEKLADNFISIPTAEMTKVRPGKPIRGEASDLASLIRGLDKDEFWHEFTLVPKNNKIEYTLTSQYGEKSASVVFTINGAYLLEKDTLSHEIDLGDEIFVKKFYLVKEFVRNAVDELRSSFYTEKEEIEL